MLRCLLRPFSRIFFLKLGPHGTHTMFLYCRMPSIPIWYSFPFFMPSHMISCCNSASFSCSTWISSKNLLVTFSMLHRIFSEPNYISRFISWSFSINSSSFTIMDDICTHFLLKTPTIMLTLLRWYKSSKCSPWDTISTTFASYWALSDRTRTSCSCDH